MLRFLHVSVARTVACGVLLVSLGNGALAAKKENPAGKEAVERFLLSKYVVSAFSLGRGPSPGGVVVQLMKPGLESAPATALTPIFSYKDGRIKKAFVTLAMNELAPLPYQTPMVITKIEAKDNYILFDLVTTEPFGGTWFKTAVHFEMGKGYQDSPDLRRIDGAIGELLAVEGGGPPQQQQTSYGAQGGGAPPPARRTAPLPARVDDPPPPPPPPPTARIAEPPPPAAPPASAIEINPGMSLEQVKRALGPPLKSTKLGTKEVLMYQRMKVTLVNGKVTDVE